VFRATVLKTLGWVGSFLRIEASIIKTEEREALRKQGLNEKTAASVLLKLFISGNEGCYTTDAP